jgi:DNA-directed RNA polymerase specialized sigma24 family protein
MFTHSGEIVRALRRYRDCYDPASTSIMAAGSGGRDPHRDPFGRGFVAHFEERSELLRRLARLDERSRSLLVLWHVAGHPVAHIARALQISRVHCYRLEKRALEVMLGEQDAGLAAASA